MWTVHNIRVRPARRCWPADAVRLQNVPQAMVAAVYCLLYEGWYLGYPFLHTALIYTAFSEFEN